LSEAGMDESNIYYEGVGESQPVASNASREGRAKNRRFELVDVIHKEVPDEAEQLNTAPQDALKRQLKSDKVSVATSKEAEKS
tara:strand:+ start:1668 stop:1916 length:249 start_codon:yes stop_codon:yes gene_type:complete